MSKAKIVFSDGSKEMAHNLDDLRERWLLKRSIANGQDPTEAIDYLSYTSAKEARRFANALAKELPLLHLRNIETKKKLKDSPSLLLRRQRDAVSAEIMYKSHVVAHLRAALKENRFDSGEPLRQIQNSPRESWKEKHERWLVESKGSEEADLLLNLYLMFVGMSKQGRIGDLLSDHERVTTKRLHNYLKSAGCKEVISKQERLKTLIELGYCEPFDEGDIT